MDFALDLVSDAYADQAMVQRLKEKYRTEAGSTSGEPAAATMLHPHRVALIPQRRLGTLKSASVLIEPAQASVQH